jgi:hypothetical protein
MKIYWWKFWGQAIRLTTGWFWSLATRLILYLTIKNNSVFLRMMSFGQVIGFLINYVDKNIKRIYANVSILAEPLPCMLNSGGIFLFSHPIWFLGVRSQDYYNVKVKVLLFKIVAVDAF